MMCGLSALHLVRVAGADQREELWRQLVAVAACFAGYQGKCDPVIPMAVLTPRA